MAWLLLVATVLCGYVTIQAFRWWTSLLNGMPFHVFSSMWSDQLKGMTLSDQAKLRETTRSSLSRGLVGVPLFCLVVTAALAWATISAFVH